MTTSLHQGKELCCREEPPTTARVPQSGSWHPYLPHCPAREAPGADRRGESKHLPLPRESMLCAKKPSGPPPLEAGLKGQRSKDGVIAQLT